MDRSERLNILFTRYRGEAQVCAEAGGYLAACVMLGAALEGALVSMAELKALRPDIEKSSEAVRDKNGDLVPPENWPFRKLLALAKELNWLPAKLPPDEDIDLHEALERGDVGDFVEYVKEVRNLVHPGKYAREYPDVSIGDKHYEDCYTVFGLSIRHLMWRLDLLRVDAMRKAQKRMQKRQADASWGDD